MHEWIVTERARLDVSLSKSDAGISRIRAKELVKNGSVLVNGRIARKGALMVNEGDTIEVSSVGEKVTETRMKAVDLKLEVLYEDDACLVINKPAGITVHPGVGMTPDEATVLHGVVHLFKQRKIPFSSASILVHRLDKETTGCLLIAKTAAAHKELQKQFEMRTVKKTYLALVAGVPNPPSAMIDASIGRSIANRTKMTVMGSSKTREAKTTYRTIDAGTDAALLACNLHTGRTHQIRVHLNAIGHPILGDTSYASSVSEKIDVKYSINDLCLHAWQLMFRSPADSKEHVVTASAPLRFLQYCKTLDLKIPRDAH